MSIAYSDAIEMYINHFPLSLSLALDFRNEAFRFLRIYVDPLVPDHLDTADAQQFLVLRSGQTTAQPNDNDVSSPSPNLLSNSKPHATNSNLLLHLHHLELFRSSSSSSRHPHRSRSTTM